MNRYLTIVLSVLSLLSLCQFLIAQPFSVKFDSIDGRGERGVGIVYDDESIYIVSNSVCEDGIRWCTPVYCIGHDGETKWSQVIENFNLSNRDNISLLDDKVYIKSHAAYQNEELQKIKLVTLDSESGEVLERIESPLSQDFTHMFSNGHLIVDDMIYVYGSSRLTSNTDIVVGSIHIMDFSGQVIESVAIEIENFNVIYDLAISDNGIYYFLLRLSNSNLSILEFDPMTYEYTQIWEDQLFNSVPRFTLTEYGFVLAGESDSTVVGLYQLVAISFSGVELWEKSYLNTGENFDKEPIADLHTTQNGDILIASTYSILATEPDKINFNAIIGRHDQDGEPIWLKTYPTFDDDDLGHAFSGFLGIKEADDGSIIGTGYVSNTSDFFDPEYENHTMVIKVGGNGCFDDDCYQEDLIEYATSTEDFQDSDSDSSLFTIAPNPANDYLILDTELPIRTISISDVMGTQLHKSNYFSGEQINISQLSSGLYFITLKNRDGDSFTTKFIVE